MTEQTLLGQRVRARREELGLTREVLAERMRATKMPGAEKASASQVERIETGKTRSPLPHTRRALAVALGWPAEELFEPALGPQEDVMLAIGELHALVEEIGERILPMARDVSTLRALVGDGRAGPLADLQEATRAVAALAAQTTAPGQRRTGS